ncbi:MAG TPA: ribosome biogenesis GTP-binding protein YihA/YsxC [Opitutaceae bacterium]|nr:ribosome biogenesis GTP-binding protein YihA/YsxC [Opitutaceae bacterium]
MSAPDLRSCPKVLRPEFAFIGRSNVGKSSLVNMLTQKKGLAKASDAPGKTKLLNFFLINRSWYLVDLPGYGFAKVGRKDRAEFNRAVADYLENRENIACVFALIDSRLPPQKIDLQFLQWLSETPAPFAIIFTKVDKQSASQTESNVARFRQTLAEAWGADLPPMFNSSAETKAGRSEILRFIDEMLAEQP